LHSNEQLGAINCPLPAGTVQNWTSNGTSNQGPTVLPQLELEKAFLR